MFLHDLQRLFLSLSCISLYSVKMKTDVPTYNFLLELIYEYQNRKNFVVFHVNFFSHTFILGFLNYVVPNLFLSSFYHSNRCWLSVCYEQSARFQEEKRDANYIKKRKFIENTVIHIQAGNQQYTITAIGMKNAFARLVAFLLDNHLLEGYRLVFFTDGADVIGCHKIFERIDSK